MSQCPRAYSARWDMGLLKVAVAVAFIAIAMVLILLKPPICITLYAGTAIYTAFIPAGLLIKWRLSKRFPLAFVVYFLSLLAAGAVVIAVPPIRAEYIELSRSQEKFFVEVLACPLGKILAVIQALALAPLVEEVVFRGIVFEEVKGRLGTTAAYLLSSILFAFLHKPGLGAVPIFIIALALAFAYNRYGLPASVLLHFIQNAAALWLSKAS